MIEIELTKGLVTVVDDEDAELDNVAWQARYDATYLTNKYQAARQPVKKNARRSTIFMHRVIMERVLNRPLLRCELVDHRDQNPLNNTRSNLRLADTSKNQMNRDVRRNNTSGFKGASWNKRREIWTAQIGLNGKFMYLGSFPSAVEAHRAYCIAAVEYHKDFAYFGSKSPFLGWSIDQLMEEENERRAA